VVIAGAIPLLILGGKAFSTLFGNRTMLAIAIFVVAGKISILFSAASQAKSTTRRNSAAVVDT